MSLPLVTVGVVSYNRLHYLRALIASARRCIDYPALQWILVDGASVEPGLREYLEIDDDLLARWQAVSAVGRMAEGVAREALLEVWTRFESAGGVHATAN